MSRRFRRKATNSKGNEKIVSSSCFPENIDTLALSGTNSGDLSDDPIVDWTRLPDDTIIQLLSSLNYRDRASLASTCKTWKTLASSPCLWSSLDLRSYKFDTETSISLSSRCSELRSVKFGGSESASAIINLRARNLKEITGDYCRDISDATLCVIAARHELLETLQIGPNGCEKITSDAIYQIALCCPRLKRLRLSGVSEIDGKAIGAFARHCLGLEEIAFTDCLSLEESEVGKVSGLRFFSIAGSRNVNWDYASLVWSQLPNLEGLDVSRTDIIPNAVSRIVSSSRSLKVLCALNCVQLEIEGYLSPSTFDRKGKLLITFFTDVFKGISNSLFPGSTVREIDVFGEWRKFGLKDRSVDNIISWLEWILSESLLRLAEANPNGIDEFWLNQGVALLLSLARSCQEDVQERAADGIATFVAMDDENANMDPARAETVMKNNGIPLLLELAKSRKEILASEAARALANLSLNTEVAKAVADEGGITVLVDLARSINKLVAEEAACGLWNLSVGEEHLAAIAEAGGVKALVDLIFKWQSGSDGVLKCAAGALANLATDDKCSMEVALVGGVHALVTLACSCKVDGVQVQAVRALANLAAHGDSNSNNLTVGQEPGVVEALVQLISSPNDGVRQEAAGALWILSFDDRNREFIAASGGIEALITLARSCLNASVGLQERAAGALWALSVSEANSIAIGREGGIASLIALARSDAENVHETATGALWSLAFNAGNALRMITDGGVPVLAHLCSSSGSKETRFTAALILALMFDGSLKSVNFDGARRMALKHIKAFVFTFADPRVLSVAASSSSSASLAKAVEAIRIHEAGHFCGSGAEIGRFVAMLHNPSPTFRGCAAFALLQFTIPGGQHATHNVDILQKAGAGRALCALAACANGPVAAKLCAKIVLKNLQHQQA